MNDVSQRSRSPRVLLVASDPGLRDAARMFLNIQGYQAEAVASLEEARSAVRDGIDLLVTEEYLHNGQTGPQVIAFLREELGVPIKFVIVTRSTEQTIHGAPPGAQLHSVSEPLYPDKLLTMLHDLID